MFELKQKNPCKCGCSRLISKGNVKERQYYRGHAPKPILNHHLCACGCGELVASDRKFVHNHHKPSLGTGKQLPPSQLCECDCGKYANPGKRFIVGHVRGQRKPKLSQLCACGKCGLMTNPGSKYINGHVWIGRNHKQDSLQKMRLPRGPWSDEQRQKLVETNAKPETHEHRSKSQKEAANRPGAREANSERQKIAQKRSEVIEKKSKSSKTTWSTPEKRKENSEAQNKPATREKRINSLAIANKKPETKERRSNSAKETWEIPEVREVRTIAAKEKWDHPGFREEMSEILKIVHNTESAKENHARAQKNNWRNPEYVEKQKISQNISPNKPESSLNNTLINRFPKEYKYTGDFSITIGGKCPDFTNINGQKKIIELYGDYWHQNDNPQDRIDLFAQYGYDTLIIWEHELKDVEKLHATLDEFHHRENQYSIYKE